MTFLKTVTNRYMVTCSKLSIQLDPVVLKKGTEPDSHFREIVDSMSNKYKILRVA